MPVAPPDAPGRLRLATWNIEWMNALFEDDGSLRDDDLPSARYQVSRGQQLAAIGIVLTALEADGVVVVEAPDTARRRSTVQALERLAAVAGLRQRRALIGFPSDSEQEIAFLWDPDVLSARHDPQGEPGARDGSGRFDGAFRYDLDTDADPEVIRWNKPPLEVAVQAGGLHLRLIGVHAKSKAAYGGRSPDHTLRIAIDNRRKQLAQCLWLRARVVAHLAEGQALVVAGDFNDGPGLDEFEALFGRSGVEIVLGQGDGPRLRDPHAEMALQSRVAAQPTTARFYDKARRRYFGALLDFMMVSPGLAPGCDWRIWHPFDDPAIAAVPELREALLVASDHFPVTLDIPLPVPISGA